MAKLIIVCGLPGTGKTTLANELSRLTGIACIHKDSIKECLFEEFGFVTLDDSKKLGKPSVATLFRLAEEQIINGVDIIIESPFNFPEDYSIFERWQNELGADVYAIICSIGGSERKRRFQERERHHAHHDIDRQLIKNIDQQKCDYFGIPGKQIWIETNRTASELVGEIIIQIG